MEYLRTATIRGAAKRLIAVFPMSAVANHTVEIEVVVYIFAQNTC
jgi:hypothetical protein